MSCELTVDEHRAKRLIAMGQMAASLAHEIRNPLGSMELFCSLLKKDLSAEPEKLGLAEQIHQGIRTLDRIINNCLQFSRDIVARKKEVADVAALLERTISVLRPRAEEHGIAISAEFSGEGPVYIDPHLFGQALLNLALNSIEAIVERQVVQSDYLGQINIISDCSRSELWQIRLIDNGQGISPENQGKIFEPFFSTKQEGTGLGLAVVHSIIAAHGGRIAITSDPGLGTSVVLEFPARV